MKQLDFLASDRLIETPTLRYTKGYKYQSRNPMVYQTTVFPPEDINTPLISLRRDGWLWVSPYFSWDGCSGIAWDDHTNMRAGQAHDALYALIRMGLLPLSYRKECDATLKRLMVDDGALYCRASYYEWAVNCFGRGPATCQRKIYEAP
jgi:hypothetical protein